MKRDSEISCFERGNISCTIRKQHGLLRKPFAIYLTVFLIIGEIYNFLVKTIIVYFFHQPIYYCCVINDFISHNKESS